MKLDKRIENERLIYTPFTTTKPKLHEKGYFTDNIHSFNNLKNCRYGELINHDDNQYSYCCEFNVNLMVEILLLGLLFTYLKVALNEKKNNSDHIPLWNLLTYSQWGGQLNIEEKGS